jgi:hypothetical protein
VFPRGPVMFADVGSGSCLSLKLGIALLVGSASHRRLSNFRVDISTTSHIHRYGAGVLANYLAM